MSTEVFEYKAKQNDDTNLEICIEQMAGGNGWVQIERSEDPHSPACGYMLAEDMVAMAEAILWAFRDGFDADKKPKGKTEIVKAHWKDAT